MKTSWIDYLWAGLAISLLLTLSGGGVCFVNPWSSRFFGDYHVLLDLAAVLLFYGVLSAIFVRLMLRWFPIAPGVYRMDSPAFVKWKLITVVYRLGQGALAPLTPIFLKPVVEALYGARMGADVALGGVIDDPYRVCVGDGAVLGHGSLVSGNFIAGGVITCGPVNIGAGATVGANAVVFPGVDIGPGATLVGGSYVMPGTKIPAGETWRGNPARKWL